MYKKFIISNGTLRKGLVDFHRQLLSTNTKNDVLGGGWFHYDKTTENIYFYGSSDEFGSVTKEQLIEALENTLLSRREEAFKYYFSTDSKLDFNKFEEIDINVED